MTPVTEFPGHFGKLVIGEKAATQEAKVVHKGEDHFGPLVLGHAVEGKRPGDAERIDKGSDHGELVTGPSTDAEPQAATMLTIPELKELLEADPATGGDFFKAELQREGGPRKGALQALVESEKGKAVPDLGLLAQMEDALEELG